MHERQPASGGGWKSTQITKSVLKGKINNFYVVIKYLPKVLVGNPRQNKKFHAEVVFVVIRLKYRLGAFP